MEVGYFDTLKYIQKAFVNVYFAQSYVGNTIQFKHLCLEDIRLLCGATSIHILVYNHVWSIPNNNLWVVGNYTSECYTWFTVQSS